MIRKIALILVAILIIGIVAGYVILTNFPDMTSTITGNGLSDLTPEQVFSEIGHMDLTDLQREENWKKYEGKKVKWTGTVEQVAAAEDKDDKAYVQISDYVDVDYDGWFPKWRGRVGLEVDKYEATKLSKGQEITYIGRLAEFKYVSILGVAGVGITDVTLVSP